MHISVIKFPNHILIQHLSLPNSPHHSPLPPLSLIAPMANLGL